jgi:hypothetical protein
VPQREFTKVANSSSKRSKSMVQGRQWIEFRLSYLLRCETMNVDVEFKKHRHLRHTSLSVVFLYASLRTLSTLANTKLDDVAAVAPGCRDI